MCDGQAAQAAQLARLQQELTQEQATVHGRKENYKEIQKRFKRKESDD